MWIRKAEWERLITKADAQMDLLSTRNTELERANSFLETTLEWMRTRLNQVELLNARVLEKALNIPVGTPTIERQFNIKELLESAGDMFRDPEQAKFSENTE